MTYSCQVDLVDFKFASTTKSKRNPRLTRIRQPCPASKIHAVLAPYGSIISPGKAHLTRDFPHNVHVSNKTLELDSRSTKRPSHQTRHFSTRALNCNVPVTGSQSQDDPPVSGTVNRFDSIATRPIVRLPEQGYDGPQAESESADASLSWSSMILSRASELKACHCRHRGSVHSWKFCLVPDMDGCGRI